MFYEALAFGCVVGCAFLGYMQERKIRQQQKLIEELQEFIEETLERCEEAVQAMEKVENP